MNSSMLLDRETASQAGRSPHAVHRHQYLAAMDVFRVVTQPVGRRAELGCLIVNQYTQNRMMS